VALNRLYSARVLDVDVETLARHIAGLGIDALLAEGSSRAVDLIAHSGKTPARLLFLCHQVL